MKYFWLFLSVFNIIAITVFIVRKDFGALPFSILALFMSSANVVIAHLEERGKWQ